MCGGVLVCKIELIGVNVGCESLDVKIIYGVEIGDGFYDCKKNVVGNGRLCYW